MKKATLFFFVTTCALATDFSGTYNCAFADNAIPITRQSTTQVLQRADVPQSIYSVGMGTGNLAPNTLKPWHTHEGPEMAYILEGSMIVTIKGQPPKTYTAGQSYEVLPGVVHETQAGPNGAKYLAVWVVEKGKKNQFLVQAH